MCFNIKCKKPKKIVKWYKLDEWIIRNDSIFFMDVVPLLSSSIGCLRAVMSLKEQRKRTTTSRSFFTGETWSRSQRGVPKGLEKRQCGHMYKWSGIQVYIHWVMPKPKVEFQIWKFQRMWRMKKQDKNVFFFHDREQNLITNSQFSKRWFSDQYWQKRPILLLCHI